MGPAPTSPRALHGWALEASSCSFRSCQAGTSVVRVLSWAKPCSASWDLRVVCIFFEEKVLPSGCSPRASCYLEQGAGGSCLEIALILRRRAPEHILGFFIKKNSDIARSGFFLSWGLEVVYLEEVFLVTCAFSKKKVHSLSVAPKPLAIWNKKLEGLESYVVWKLLSWRSLLSDVRFFEEKSALTECSLRASCYLEQRVWGSWFWVVQVTENLFCCSPRAYTWVLLSEKNSDIGSWHVLW